MEKILSFVKDYFIFMMVLFLFSYLAPKEEYRKYFQFFIGVLMVAILMRPVAALFYGEGEELLREKMERIESDIGQMEYYEKGENIYERFLEDVGMDTQAAEEP